MKVFFKETPQTYSNLHIKKRPSVEGPGIKPYQTYVKMALVGTPVNCYYSI